MAKALSGGWYERQVGEPCPRGSVTKSGETPCRGALEPVLRGYQSVTEEEMRCDRCRHSWDRRFRLKDISQAGRPPKWVMIPDELVEALAESIWDHKETIKHADPRYRISWERCRQDMVMAASEEITAAREILEPIWVEFGRWFADFFGIDSESPDEVNARRAITEIAIPMLLHCESEFGIEPSARINLERVNVRAKVANGSTDET